MQTLLRNKFWLIGIGVLVAGALWYALSSQGAPASDAVLTSSTGSGASATADASSQDVVEMLLALRAISLDGTVFTNPAFIALKDYSTQIQPEPVGRQNPFAPIGVGGGTAAAAAAVPAASTQAPATGAGH